jgi:hypothetical protein
MIEMVTTWGGEVKIVSSSVQSSSPFHAWEDGHNFGREILKTRWTVKITRLKTQVHSSFWFCQNAWKGHKWRMSKQVDPARNNSCHVHQRRGLCTLSVANMSWSQFGKVNTSQNLKSHMMMPPAHKNSATIDCSMIRIQDQMNQVRKHACPIHQRRGLCTLCVANMPWSQFGTRWTHLKIWNHIYDDATCTQKFSNNRLQHDKKTRSDAPSEETYLPSPPKKSFVHFVCS